MRGTRFPGWKKKSLMYLINLAISLKATRGVSSSPTVTEAIHNITDLSQKVTYVWSWDSCRFGFSQQFHVYWLAWPPMGTPPYPHFHPHCSVGRRRQGIPEWQQESDPEFSSYYRWFRKQTIQLWKIKSDFRALLRSQIYTQQWTCSPLNW